MWETLTLFAPSYAATLAMGLVCAYLGVFCVMRRIVFTGVALAQLAAAGVAVSFFVADRGLGPISRFAGAYGSTWGSLGASLAGLLGLQARPRQGRLTQDALVGLAYSAAAAFAILLVWRSSRGLTELQNILAGTVLLPRQSELVSLWIGLGAVAIVHAVLRRELLLVSFDPEFARAAGLPERRYQLVFLATLAVAVALALKAGGLLLVFAFLVVPPLAGLALGERLGESTVLALCAAAGGSLLGFLCSIGWDWPVGPSVAASLVALLGLFALGRLHARVGQVVRYAALALGAAAVLAAPVALLAAPADEPAPAPVPVTSSEPPAHGHGGDGGDDPHAGVAAFTELAAQLEQGDPAARAEAAAELVGAGGPDALGPLLGAVLDPEPDVRAAVDAALAVLIGDPSAAGAFGRLLGDPEVAPALRARAGIAATRLGDPRGLAALVATLEATDPDLPLILQDEAVALLRAERGGVGFGYDAFFTPEENAAALAAWRDWLAGRRGDALGGGAAEAAGDAGGVIEDAGDVVAGDVVADEGGEVPEAGAGGPSGGAAPSDAELREAALASAAVRLREGPDRTAAARALLDLGPEGRDLLEGALAEGSAASARAAVAALDPATVSRLLAAGAVAPAAELDAARAIVDAAAAGREDVDSAPALARLGAAEAPAEEDLARVLGAREAGAEAARRAWAALAARRAADAAGLVARWLASGDAGRVRAAATGLADLAAPTATFASAWAAAEGGAREALVAALADRAGPELSAPLRARFDGVGGAGRAALVRRFGRELDAAGWPLVGRALEDRDPDVRRAAREALTEFAAAREARREWEALEERDAAAEVVADLRGLLRDEDAAVAAEAARALADLGAREALPDLIEALARPGPELHEALRDAIERLGLRRY